LGASGKRKKNRISPTPSGASWAGRWLAARLEISLDQAGNATQMNYHGPCKGITKKGLPCRAVVVHENGFCKAHGGNYYPNRDRMLLERAIARSERRTRKIDALLKKAAKHSPRLAEWFEKKKRLAAGMKVVSAVTELASLLPTEVWPVDESKKERLAVFPPIPEEISPDQESTIPQER
jgi:hypothetical protein